MVSILVHIPVVPLIDAKYLDSYWLVEHFSLVLIIHENLGNRRKQF